MASMNHYERVGVEREADFSAIKKAYFKSVKLCHPDLFGGDREKEEEFKLLVAAFDVLSDPVKRQSYDASLGLEERKTARGDAAFTPSAYDGQSIMDTPADDTLEEFIVGNNLPPNATLATLFLDLERTEVFMAFREGKNHFFDRHFTYAKASFGKAIKLSPCNILYHYYYARTCAILGDFAAAAYHYRTAVRLGDARRPQQHLVRIRAELEAAYQGKNPFIHSLLSLFRKKRPTIYVPEEQRMIEQANRCIGRILAESKDKERKKLKS